jgi:hypothetical protein
LCRVHPPGIEYKSRLRLENLGLIAYIPLLRRMIKPRYVHGLRELCLPLLGPYFFALPADDDVGRTRLLLRERAKSVNPVSAGKNRGWLTVPYSDVNDLIRREDAGEFTFGRIDMSKPQEFRVGDWVLVVGTGLDGKRGVVLKRFNGHAYQVAVGSLRVTAKADQLQPAGSVDELAEFGAYHSAERVRQRHQLGRRAKLFRRPDGTLGRR